ncbi:hypothetical protein ACHAWF_003118 [Thalassiosira exigua]
MCGLRRSPGVQKRREAEPLGGRYDAIVLHDVFLPFPAALAPRPSARSAGTAPDQAKVQDDDERGNHQLVEDHPRVASVAMRAAGFAFRGERTVALRDRVLDDPPRGGGRASVPVARFPSPPEAHVFPAVPSRPTFPLVADASLLGRMLREDGADEGFLEVVALVPAAGAGAGAASAFPFPSPSAAGFVHGRVVRVLR